MRPSALRESFRLLATRRFGTFWLATLLSNIGTWAQQVAEPWLLLSLGASPFLLGLDSFAMGAPVFLLTLAGGVLADKADRRRVIALFQSTQMLCPLIIVVLLVTGLITPWMVVVLSLVVGITDALSMPSFQTIVPSIVRPEQLATGIALNSTQFSLARILGPAIAGVLMSTLGATGAFTVSALSYLPFILIALWVLPRGAVARLEGGAFGFKPLREGLREVMREPAMRGAVSTVLVSSTLTAPLVTFAPVLVRDQFQGAVGHFSIAMGAFGVGGLLGGIAMMAIDPSRDRRRMSSRPALAFALLALLSSLDPWFWALPLLFGLAGLAMTVSNASANTVLMAAAPTALRGRASSVFMLALRGGIAVGSLLTGLSVSVLGVRTALCVNGLLAAGLQLVIARRWLTRAAS